MKTKRDKNYFADFAERNTQTKYIIIWYVDEFTFLINSLLIKGDI